MYINTCSLGTNIHVLISIFLLHVSVVNNHLHAVHQIVGQYSTFFTVPNILVHTQFNKEHEHSRLQLNVEEKFGNKYVWLVGQHSVVTIVTHYGLDNLGIKSPWGEIFHTHPDWPRGLPSLLYKGYWVFPGRKNS